MPKKPCRRGPKRRALATAKTQSLRGYYPLIRYAIKEPALYHAIENVFDKQTTHRDNKYKNNKIEQDHRGIKSRYGVTKGLKNIFPAAVFCTAFEEIRQLFSRNNKTRAERRRLFASKIKELNQLSTEMI